jgi:hypothetical protein
MSAPVPLETMGVIFSPEARYRGAQPEAHAEEEMVQQAAEKEAGSRRPLPSEEGAAVSSVAHMPEKVRELLE